MSHGSLGIFLARPTSLVLLLLAATLVLLPVVTGGLSRKGRPAARNGEDRA
jgi:TctA family transporter